ncbi:MAG: NAD-dependent protein deacylase [Rhodospirillaceae bacterium]|nr:NAD-dependent protein deacylase [Rhodospirillaceae bacterium]MCY4310010.1 NAD-dependent protein deacylase [Rhodospirillaceae bacterium]
MAGRRAGNIVILTGAGISKESGLDTFRDADGLWSKVNLEDVATPEGFIRNPQMVHDFYNHRRRELQKDNIRANAAHHALGRLEAEWPDDVLVVTQNIDALHEEGGSENLIHMHGEMLKARCDRCGNVRCWVDDIDIETACPECAVAGGMRPHVVWFGEMPFEMERISQALSQCSLFISIGTSGNVYPAAGFVREAIFSAKAHTVELNMEPSEGATLFAETVYGPATAVVPAYVDRLLAEGY